MDRRPHSSTLRKGRFSGTGQIYLVTTRTDRRTPHFAAWQAGRIIVATMQKIEALDEAGTLAYVVMPDHLHWLVELNKGTLSEVVKRVKGVNAKALNELYGTEGRRVWQSGFHDHAVREEEDLVPIARYLVANPLRAGLVERLGDYPLWDAVWL